MTAIGRLALREEGANWNVYYALPGTMDGAIFIGSVVMTVVATPELKQAFVDFMTRLVGDLIEREIGKPVTWNDPERAPEAERAGRACFHLKIKRRAGDDALAA